MSVRQISVFVENRPGSLLAMTTVLGENGIDMRAFSLAETSDFGIARFIVDDTDKTAAVLREAGFVLSVTPVLGVAIPDVPGGLNQVLSVLRDAQVNVEYMYAFLGGRQNRAYMIFKVTDEKSAAFVLNSAGARLVDQEELSDM